jgi:hypothetical protein
MFHSPRIGAAGLVGPRWASASASLRLRTFSTPPWATPTNSSRSSWHSKSQSASQSRLEQAVLWSLCHHRRPSTGAARLSCADRAPHTHSPYPPCLSHRSPSVCLPRLCSVPILPFATARRTGPCLKRFRWTTTRRQPFSDLIGSSHALT